MSFSIRPVLLSESAQLTAISRSTFMEAFEAVNTPENLQHYLDTYMTETVLVKELQAPQSAFYFIVDESNVCGYLKLNTGAAQKEDMGEGSMELERIYISKAYWASGLGQQLLDVALDVARRAGMRRIWLGVWEHNERALRFYAKNGFAPFGSHLFVMGDDPQTDILMEHML
jgi:diamine N-acetyltransferase